MKHKKVEVEMAKVSNGEFVDNEWAIVVKVWSISHGTPPSARLRRFP